MNIELPFKIKEIPLKTYQYQAYSTGIIISSSKAGIMDWLISHSLEIVASEINFYVYYSGDCPNLFQKIKYQPDDCFDRHSLDLPSFYLNTYKTDVLNIINNMLKEEYYIHGYWNEYFIPSRSSYHDDNFDHDYLIIGSDDIEKEFLVVGYNTSRQLVIEKISYETYMQAVSQKSEHYSSLINFYKVKERQYSFDKGLVHQAIINFLESKSNSEYACSAHSYGQDALKKIISLIDTAIEKDPYSIVKIVKAYFEHCYFIDAFLKKIDVPQISKENVDNFSDWKEQKELFVAYSIKYCITFEQRLIDKIMNAIKNMIDVEIHLIYQLDQFFGISALNQSFTPNKNIN